MLLKAGDVLPVDLQQIRELSHHYHDNPTIERITKREIERVLNRFVARLHYPYLVEPDTDA